MKSAFTFELNFRIMTYEDVTPMFPDPKMIDEIDEID